MPNLHTASPDLISWVWSCECDCPNHLLLIKHMLMNSNLVSNNESFPHVNVFLSKSIKVQEVCLTSSYTHCWCTTWLITARCKLSVLCMYPFALVHVSTLHWSYYTSFISHEHVGMEVCGERQEDMNPFGRFGGKRKPLFKKNASFI